MNENVIVSLTSWPKRIINLPVVLDCIWKQTVQPNVVILNLSEEEFPNRNLPDFFVDYINQHERLRINWVQENTRVWKKFLPILKLYPDAFKLLYKNIVLLSN